MWVVNLDPHTKFERVRLERGRNVFSRHRAIYYCYVDALKETLIDHLLCALCCMYNNKQYEVLPPKNLTKTLIKFQGDTKVFS